MRSNTTELNIHWGTAVSEWVFTATRGREQWQWTVSPEEFKMMIIAMQDMDDELMIAQGQTLRNDINRRDN